MTESRINRHDKHLVHIGQDFLDHGCRSGRINNHPGPLAQRLDALDCPMQIIVTLPMHQERIRPSGHELIQEHVRVRDHEVNLQRQSSNRAQRFYYHGAERNVRHEMAVHYIDMDAVRSTVFGLGNLFTQASEIGCENGRSNFDSVLEHEVSSLASSSCGFHSVTFACGSPPCFLLNRGGLKDALNGCI